VSTETTAANDPNIMIGVRIPVAVTAAHAHLTRTVIEQLFCDLYQLHPRGPPIRGEYDSFETVTLIGPHGRLRKVPVVGPPILANQIEISRTEALILGIRTPVRESGDLIGTPGLTIEGPRSQVVLGTGLICPLRHIHMNPMEAVQFNLKDRDRVEVSIRTTNRSLRFDDVLVRVAAPYSMELHLDSDEANAAGVQSGDFAMLVRRSSANDVANVSAGSNI
jgi:propanediol utilization protein